MLKYIVDFSIFYCYFVTLKLPVMFDDLQRSTVDLLPFFYTNSFGKFIFLNYMDYNNDDIFNNIISAADDLTKNGYLLDFSFSLN